MPLPFFTRLTSNANPNSCAYVFDFLKKSPTKEKLLHGIRDWLEQLHNKLVDDQKNNQEFDSLLTRVADPGFILELDETIEDKTLNSKVKTFLRAVRCLISVEFQSTKEDSELPAFQETFINDKHQTVPVWDIIYATFISPWHGMILHGHLVMDDLNKMREIAPNACDKVGLIEDVVFQIATYTPLSKEGADKLAEKYPFFIKLPEQFYLKYPVYIHLLILRAGLQRGEMGGTEKGTEDVAAYSAQKAVTRLRDWLPYLSESDQEKLNKSSTWDILKNILNGACAHLQGSILETNLKIEANAKNYRSIRLSKENLPSVSLSITSPANYTEKELVVMLKKMSDDIAHSSITQLTNAHKAILTQCLAFVTSSETPSHSRAKILHNLLFEENIGEDLILHEILQQIQTQGWSNWLHSLEDFNLFLTRFRSCYALIPSMSTWFINNNGHLVTTFKEFINTARRLDNPLLIQQLWGKVSPGIKDELLNHADDNIAFLLLFPMASLAVILPAIHSEFYKGLRNLRFFTPPTLLGIFIQSNPQDHLIRTPLINELAAELVTDIKHLRDLMKQLNEENDQWEFIQSTAIKNKLTTLVDSNDSLLSLVDLFTDENRRWELIQLPSIKNRMGLVEGVHNLPFLLKLFTDENRRWELIQLPAIKDRMGTFIETAENLLNLLKLFTDENHRWELLQLPDIKNKLGFLIKTSLYFFELLALFVEENHRLDIVQILASQNNLEPIKEPSDLGRMLNLFSEENRRWAVIQLPAIKDRIGTFINTEYDLVYLLKQFTEINHQWELIQLPEIRNKLGPLVKSRPDRRELPKILTLFTGDEVRLWEFIQILNEQGALDSLVNNGDSLLNLLRLFTDENYRWALIQLPAIKDRMGSLIANDYDLPNLLRLFTDENRRWELVQLPGNKDKLAPLIQNTFNRPELLKLFSDKDLRWNLIQLPEIKSKLGSLINGTYDKGKLHEILRSFTDDENRLWELVIELNKQGALGSLITNIYTLCYLLDLFADESHRWELMQMRDVQDKLGALENEYQLQMLINQFSDENRRWSLLRLPAINNKLGFITKDNDSFWKLLGLFKDEAHWLDIIQILACQNNLEPIKDTYDLCRMLNLFPQERHRWELLRLPAINHKLRVLIKDGYDLIKLLELFKEEENRWKILQLPSIKERLKVLIKDGYDLSRLLKLFTDEKHRWDIIHYPGIEDRLSMLIDNGNLLQVLKLFKDINYRRKLAQRFENKVKSFEFWNDYSRDFFAQFDDENIQLNIIHILDVKGKLECLSYAPCTNWTLLLKLYDLDEFVDILKQPDVENNTQNMFINLLKLLKDENACWKFIQTPCIKNELSSLIPNLASLCEFLQLFSNGNKRLQILLSVSENLKSLIKDSNDLKQVLCLLPDSLQSDFISIPYIRDTFGPQILDAFLKIHEALFKGETSVFKRENPEVNASVVTDILKFSKADPNTNREAMAFSLALKHFDNCNSRNTELFTEIYKWSYNKSGIFKQTSHNNSSWSFWGPFTIETLQPNTPSQQSRQGSRSKNIAEALDKGKMSYESLSISQDKGSIVPRSLPH